MITDRHIKNLWVRMAQIYGHKWVSNHSDHDANGTWLIGLEDLTPELIAEGLRRCLRRPDQWPPSLPEFRALCLGIPDEATLIRQVIFGGRDVTHVAMMVRRQIPSWDFEHGSERELAAKAKAILADILESRQIDLVRAATMQLPGRKPEAIGHD